MDYRFAQFSFGSRSASPAMAGGWACAKNCDVTIFRLQSLGRGLQALTMATPEPAGLLTKRATNRMIVVVDAVTSGL